MENTVLDYLQLTETSNMTLDMTSNKASYVSFIKINGKPILPPLINEDRRKELQKYKQKAIEIELRLAKQRRSKNIANLNQISSEVSSISNVPPNRQSTPTRPASLNLSKRAVGKAFVLPMAKAEGFSSTNMSVGSDEIISSQRSAKNLGRAFRSTLEHRLATENGITVRNKLNKCEQSPIREEHIPDKFIDSDSDLRRETNKWSPLQIDSINFLKIELPTKDSQDLEDYADESLKTPDTVTHSPNLKRQNSYTLLTPSPALLQFLETQKDHQNVQRSHSGRKTWDLSNAKKNWDPENGALDKSSDEDGENEEHTSFLDKKNSSSLDSLSANQEERTKDPEDCEYSVPNSFAYDSGTSPDSYNPRKDGGKVSKVKCKFKGKKVRSTKSVPSPDSADKVPLKDLTKMGRGSLHDFTLGNELPDLSNLLFQMKVDFERQKKELEEKQQSEMKKLEIVYQRKEAELLSKVSSHLPKKSTKSIYSQSSRESWHRDIDPRMMGDGHQNRTDRKENSVSEHCLGQQMGRRPHSAKDFHPECCSHENDCSRRARSMDFNQDTDLDISFQDDFLQSKGKQVYLSHCEPPLSTPGCNVTDLILDTTLNNEYVIESDSMSNLSSQSSSGSSANRRELIHPLSMKKFQGISSEEYAKYSQAASKINAGARGYLTRRLLRTAHVQGLITTLKDAITCATQLHTASDIADSDIDLMRRLSRQIEAAWEAVYAVFFNTKTSAKLQLISADRERLRAALGKTPTAATKKKRISSATRKSLDRKSRISTMSKSQTSNGFGRVRMCSKMAASYPSPYFPQRLK